MRVRSSLVAIAAVALLAVPAGRAGQTEAQLLRVIAFGGVATVPLLAAETTGAFARAALNVAVEFTPNSQLLRSGLAAGKYDIAHAAVDNAVAMAETDGTDVVVVLGGDDSMNELFVQPGIESASALRGKTVVVDAPDTAYALQLRKILLDSGLDAGRDYTLKPIGGTPQRLQAMLQASDAAASMLNPPYSIMARQRGLKSLGSARKLVGRYQGIGAFVRRPWARENRDLLVRYLSAYIAGLRWFVDPANKAAAVALLTSGLKLQPEVAGEAYEEAVAPTGLAHDAQLDVEGLSNVLKLRAEIQRQWKGIPPVPARYYDLTYYEAALARLDGR